MLTCKQRHTAGIFVIYVSLKLERKKSRSGAFKISNLYADLLVWQSTVPINNKAKGPVQRIQR